MQPAAYAAQVCWPGDAKYMRANTGRERNQNRLLPTMVPVLTLLNTVAMTMQYRMDAALHRGREGVWVRAYVFVFACVHACECGVVCRCSVYSCARGCVYVIMCACV